MINNAEEIITCDGEGCQEHEPYDSYKFGESIKYLRSIGWQVIKTIDGWRHYCARCKS